MSYFRNFNKVVNAKLFTKPNNILFRSCNTPVQICTSNQPSIDHLNTLKALHLTISRIQSHSQSATSFTSIIDQQLSYLNSVASNYKAFSVKYVEIGGKLTAQGLANLYACAEQLQISSQWLTKYVYDQIPHHIPNMSISNLQDTIKGVEKYHQNSEYLQLLKKELDSRNHEPFQYVKRFPNDTNIFQETVNTKSNNILLNTLENGNSKIHYYARKALQFELNVYKSLTKRPVRSYVLHDE